MIDINFFEKKSINVLPYILAGVFLIFLALGGTYLYLTRAYYTNVQQDRSEWISANAEEVALSRQIQQLDELANQSTQVQETLNQSQFPMVYVTEDLLSAVGSELDQVSTYQLSEGNQVILFLENTEVSEVSAMIEELETKAYVDRVQFLRLESQQTESDQYAFELTVDLNSETLSEGVEQ